MFKFDLATHLNCFRILSRPAIEYDKKEIVRETRPRFKNQELLDSNSDLAIREFDTNG